MTGKIKNEPVPPMSLPVEDGRVFTKNGDFVSSEFGDGESVLFSARDRRCFLLNATASRIYGLTDGRRNVRIVCDMIAEHYSAGQERITKDVKQVYRTFMERGIVAHE